jgi:hypothetical protein
MTGDEVEVSENFVDLLGDKDDALAVVWLFIDQVVERLLLPSAVLDVMLLLNRSAGYLKSKYGRSRAVNQAGRIRGRRSLRTFYP